MILLVEDIVIPYKNPFNVRKVLWLMIVPMELCSNALNVEKMTNSLVL